MRKVRLMPIVSVVLAIVLTASTFSGCNKKTEKQPEVKAAETAAVSGQTKLPLVEKPVKLKMWAAMHANHISAGITNFSEIAAFAELEKRTNMQIEWNNPSPQNSKEQFQLMIATRDLPDAFLYSTAETAEGDVSRKMLTTNGAVLKLNDLMNKVAPNVKKELQSVPGLWKDTVDDTGTLWAIPAYTNDIDLGGMALLMQIRRDWLKKLNLKEPKTQDEWYKVLKAFRDNDPNGNGKKDEIPLGAAKNEMGLLESIMFNTQGIARGFYVLNGKVKYGDLEPEFKKGIEIGAKFYKEGILDPDFLTLNLQQLEKSVLENKVGASYRRQQVKVTQYKAQLKDKLPEYDMWVTAFPQAQDGKSYIFDPTFTSAVRGLGLYISSLSKNAELIMKWVDYQYTDEGARLMNYGIEGTSYNMVNGKPLIDEKIYDIPGKGFNLAARAKYTATGNGTFEWISRKPKTEKVDGKWPVDVTMGMGDVNLFEDSYKVRNQADFSRVLPTKSLSFTDQESSIYVKKMVDINTYRDEMYAKFITGVEGVDKVEAYQSQLKKMGLEEVIVIYQAAYDRYMKR